MKMFIIPPPKYYDIVIFDATHIPRVGEFVHCNSKEYGTANLLRVAKIEYTMFGAGSDIVELYLEEQ